MTFSIDETLNLFGYEFLTFDEMTFSIDETLNLFGYEFLTCSKASL